MIVKVAVSAEDFDYIELPKDPNLWPERALEFLNQLHPEIARFPKQILPIDVNEEEDYGLIAVAVGLGSEVILIPMVVSDGKLLEPHVFYDQNEEVYKPLTPFTVSEVLIRQQPLGGESNA